MPSEIRNRKRGRAPRAVAASTVEVTRPKRNRKLKSNVEDPRKLVRVPLVDVEDIVKRMLELHRISPWMETEDAARYLGRQPGTLKRWRSTGDGPPFHVVNQKFIRYHVDDLDRYVRGMSALTTQSTL